MSYASALNNAHTFDNRPRTTADGKPAPKIFVGEWATLDSNRTNPTPSFHAALTDAAFLTGLERNADLIVMSCYAPLFVNVSNVKGPQMSMQWPTNLIGYDALNSFGSPSYYVQKMFYNNKGDVVLPVTLTPQLATAAPAPAVAPAGQRIMPDVPKPRRRAPSRRPVLAAAVGPPHLHEPWPFVLLGSRRDDATGDAIIPESRQRGTESPQQMEISLGSRSAPVGKTAINWNSSPPASPK